MELERASVRTNRPPREPRDFETLGYVPEAVRRRRELGEQTPRGHGVQAAAAARARRRERHVSHDARGLVVRGARGLLPVLLAREAVRHERLRRALQRFFLRNGDPPARRHPPKRLRRRGAPTAVEGARGLPRPSHQRRRRVRVVAAHIVSVAVGVESFWGWLGRVVFESGALRVGACRHQSASRTSLFAFRLFGLRLAPCTQSS